MGKGSGILDFTVEFIKDYFSSLTNDLATSKNIF